MKGFLKYLLPIVAAAIFWCCKSAAAETASAYAPIQEDICQTSISACDSELCLPLQNNTSYGCRLQNVIRRNSGVQKLCLAFIKSGKIQNASRVCSSLRKSFILHSTLVIPLIRLHSLGKLII